MSLNKKHTIIIILCLTLGLSSCQDKTSKIWLHCANDTNKAQYFQDKYAGLEIDITYSDSLQTLLVQKGNNNKHTPITLEQWLDKLDTINDIGIWLDFKNLNRNNNTSILEELNRLCSKYNIKKDNLIVESSAPYCLPIFQDANYKTSFYIPKFKPKRSSQNEIQRHTQYIRDAISKYDITTISGYYYQYEFMRDSFPDKNVMIWYIHNNPMIRNRCIKLANNDDNVKVLLVADEVPFYKTLK